MQQVGGNAERRLIFKFKGGGMSQKNYEQLIREWAQLTSATDVEALLQRGRVKVRDTIIDLVYHDDEEEEPHRLLVDGAEVHALRLPSEGDAELVDDERAAVGNGDAPPDARGAEVLATLQHLEEHPLGLLVELEQPDHLLEDVVLARAFELQLDRVFREELAQFHRVPRTSKMKNGALRRPTGREVMP